MDLAMVELKNGPGTEDYCFREENPNSPYNSRILGFLEK